MLSMVTYAEDLSRFFLQVIIQILDQEPRQDIVSGLTTLIVHLSRKDELKRSNKGHTKTLTHTHTYTHTCKSHKGFVNSPL